MAILTAIAIHAKTEANNTDVLSITKIAYLHFCITHATLSEDGSKISFTQDTNIVALGKRNTIQ